MARKLPGSCLEVATCCETNGNFWYLVAAFRLLVAAMLKPVPVAPGHDLFAQRACADSVFILQDGELASAPLFHFQLSSTLDSFFMLQDSKLANAHLFQSQLCSMH